MKITALLPLPLLAFALPAVAQPPAAGVETRADAEAKAAALFKRLDLDGDGVITRDEMARFVAARTGQPVVPGAPLPPAAAAMFDDGDTDHDGRITRAEAIGAALRGFDEADANHDGKVTPEERDAATRRVQADIPAPASATPAEVSGPPAPQE